MVQASFIQCLCLLSVLLRTSQSEILEPPQISSTGWPPRVVVIWKTIALKRKVSVIKIHYDVILCTCNYTICPQLLSNLKNGSASVHLQIIPYCRQYSSQEGQTLKCNVTGRVKNCEQTSFDLQKRNFYAVIKASSNIGTNYSAYTYLDLFQESKCPKPAGFNGTETQEGNVHVTWAHPLNMNRDVIFQVFYTFHSINCAHSRKANKTLESCTSLSCEASDLLPNTKYTFYITCSPKFHVFEDKWGESSVFSIRTKDRVPSISPTHVKRVMSRDRFFGTLRNITLEWEFPFCPISWGGGQATNFTIYYWPSYNSSSMDIELQGEHQLSSTLMKKLIVNDISSRNVVIGYLDRHSNYFISMIMCSTAGCGPSSKLTYVEGEGSKIVSTFPPIYNKATNYVVTIIVPVFSPLALVVIASFCFCYFKRRRDPVHRSSQIPLTDRIGELGCEVPENFLVPECGPDDSISGSLS